MFDGYCSDTCDVTCGEEQYERSGAKRRDSHIKERWHLDAINNAQ